MGARLAIASFALDTFVTSQHGDPYCWTDGRTWENCCMHGESPHCWQPVDDEAGAGAEYSHLRCCLQHVTNYEISWDVLQQNAHDEHISQKVADMFSNSSLGVVIIRDIPHLAQALAYVDEVHDRLLAVLHSGPSNQTDLTCHFRSRQSDKHHERAAALLQGDARCALQRIEGKGWTDTRQILDSKEQVHRESKLQGHDDPLLANFPHLDLLFYAAAHQVTRLTEPLMRLICKILDERYGPLPVSLESLLASAVMHVPFKHYTARPWGVLPPFAAKNAYPGTINETEFGVRLLYDQRRLQVLHNWHVDDFWIVAAFKTRFVPRPGDSNDAVEDFEDQLFFLDARGAMHRVHPGIGENDLAIWFGKEIQDASNGAIRAAVHTVLFSSEYEGLWQRGYERHSMQVMGTPSGRGWMDPLLSSASAGDTSQIGSLKNYESETSLFEQPCLHYCTRTEHYPWMYEIHADVDSHSNAIPGQPNILLY